MLAGGAAGGSLNVEDDGCSFTLPFISFSLLAVTFGISWEGVFFSERPSRALPEAFSVGSFLLLSSFSFLVLDDDLEVRDSLAFAPSPSLS